MGCSETKTGGGEAGGVLGLALRRRLIRKTGEPSMSTGEILRKWRARRPSGLRRERAGIDPKGWWRRYKYHPAWDSRRQLNSGLRLGAYAGPW